MENFVISNFEQGHDMIVTMISGADSDEAACFQAQSSQLIDLFKTTRDAEIMKQIILFHRNKSGFGDLYDMMLHRLMLQGYPAFSECTQVFRESNKAWLGETTKTTFNLPRKRPGKVVDVHSFFKT